MTNGELQHDCAGPINRDVGSKDALNLARRRLDECANHGPDTHLQCPIFNKHGATHFPKRLINIIPNEGRLALLLIVTIPTARPQHSCLSYCWGIAQPVTSTKATLLQHMEGIDIFSLPQTLQVAVETTHELSLCFI